MPLRHIEELRRWIERESPSVLAQRAACHFLAEIGDESWRHPSLPIAELSNQPEYEVRQAALPVEGEDRPVCLWYRHDGRLDPVRSRLRRQPCSRDWA